MIAAIIGDDNANIERTKLAWEPARFAAYVNYNIMVGKRDKLRHIQQLMRFPWEQKVATPDELVEIRNKVMAFRDTVRNKWGLKYPGDK